MLIFFSLLSLFIAGFRVWSLLVGYFALWSPGPPREMSLFYFFFNLVYRARVQRASSLESEGSEVLLSIMFFGSCTGGGVASRVLVIRTLWTVDQISTSILVYFRQIMSILFCHPGFCGVGFLLLASFLLGMLVDFVKIRILVYIFFLFYYRSHIILATL